MRMFRDLIEKCKTAIRLQGTLINTTDRLSGDLTAIDVFLYFISAYVCMYMLVCVCARVFLHVCVCVRVRVSLHVRICFVCVYTRCVVVQRCFLHDPHYWPTNRTTEWISEWRFSSGVCRVWGETNRSLHSGNKKTSSCWCTRSGQQRIPRVSRRQVDFLCPGHLWLRWIILSAYLDRPVSGRRRSTKWQLLFYLLSVDDRMSCEQRNGCLNGQKMLYSWLCFLSNYFIHTAVWCWL